MNTDQIKEEITNNINKPVRITVYGLRNKSNIFEGVITNTYPYIFTVFVEGENKSFSYADVLTKEVVIEYI